MNALRRILIGSALSVMACGLASATTLTCTGITHLTDLGSSTTPDDLICPDIASVSIPAGYQLSDIILTITGGYTQSVVLTNGSPQEVTASAQTTTGIYLGRVSGFSFALSPAAGLVPNCQTPAPGCNIVEAFSTGSANLNAAPGPGNTATVNGSATLTPYSTTDTTVLSPYIGSGTFGIPIFAETTTAGVGGGGNVSTSPTTTATINATVEYDFSPIANSPEPTTMVLFGSSLIGLGLLGKRICKS